MKAGGDVPCLHVCLAVLLGLGVIELKCTDTSTSHQEERNVLEVLDFLLVRVLQATKYRISHSRVIHGTTHIEDLEDVQVADD